LNHKMKRWMIAAMVMAVMFVAIVGTSSATVAPAYKPPYWGNQIGSFTYNGHEVGAYSNGYSSFVYRDRGTFGYQFQCVEYVNRFYVQALGHKNMVGTGNANQYFATASSKGLIAYKNGGTTPPQMGDIICSNGNGVNVGHVAIVRQVIDPPTGVKSIRVIHQNWANIPSKDKYGAWIYNPDANYKELIMTKINGKYTVNSFGSGYPVTGWLHKQN
jgi:CHAP domain